MEAARAAARAMIAEMEGEAKAFEPIPVEQWHSITDALSALGYNATVEGGGAACPFIEITFSDGRVGLLGDVNENWTIDLYDSRSDIEDGTGPDTTLDLGIPARLLPSDLFNVYCDGEVIADALRRLHV
jgi:hypothetical protein